MGREQSFADPPRSALLPEKLHDLKKNKVFEASFPLHEVRPSTGGLEEKPREVEEQNQGGRGLWVPGAASRPLMKSSTKLPAAACEQGWELQLGNTGNIPVPTNFSALQKEEKLLETWAHWRGIYHPQPIKEIR